MTIFKMVKLVALMRETYMELVIWEKGNIKQEKMVKILESIMFGTI